MSFKQHQSKRRTRAYWAAQIIGWLIFAGGNALNLFLRDQLFSGVLISLGAMFVAGITTSHVFRELYHRWNWNQLSPWALLPRVLIVSGIESFIFTLIVGGVNDLLPERIANTPTLTSSAFFLVSMNFVLLFLLWNFLYFTVHYFENQRRVEIRNLELRAVNTEIELSNLRNQLRPHFMFNSLNSIRALIEEDPEKAKVAVTTLSSILRNTLLIGKHQLVPLSEELELVHKYLEMEKIRFEERLEYTSDVAPSMTEAPVPPLIVQTLVENGIKHGIAKLTSGGALHIQISDDQGNTKIVVENSGSIQSENGPESTKTGLENIEKRLQLLYKEKASFDIKEQDRLVICTLIIPKTIDHEGTRS
ncbi:MAG: histidine kinase [Flavobacteriales bacterium]|nr:histidine kinase [Flavobacteriales bacterium]